MKLHRPLYAAPSALMRSQCRNIRGFQSRYSRGLLTQSYARGPDQVRSEDPYLRWS
jgi:hypothetical protein